MGAGLGFGSDLGYAGGLVAYGGASGLGALGGSVRGFAPFGTALVEFALSPHLRVGVSVNGGYAHLTHRADATTPGSVVGPTESGSFGGSLTARWVLNPGGVVEVSPIVGFGARWNTAKGVPAGSTQNADGTTAYLTAHGDGYGIEGRLGLVLERKLLPQLYLRFENYLVRAGYDVSDVVTKAAAGNQTDHLAQTNLGIAWTPALQLRLTF